MALQPPQIWYTTLSHHQTVSKCFREVIVNSSDCLFIGKRSSQFVHGIVAQTAIKKMLKFIWRIVGQHNSRNSNERVTFSSVRELQTESDWHYEKILVIQLPWYSKWPFLSQWFIMFLPTSISRHIHWNLGAKAQERADVLIIVITVLTNFSFKQVRNYWHVQTYSSTFNKEMKWQIIFSN